MNKITAYIARAIAESLLYALAAPWLLLRWWLARRAAWRSLAPVRRGTITCPACETENELARIAKCQVCGATEAGSLVYCSFCRTTSSTVTCTGCGSTLRVLDGKR